AARACGAIEASATSRYAGRPRVGITIDTDIGWGGGIGLISRRESRFDGTMVLFLHNRYRTTGGEERTVEDLLWLVRERLHEPAELLARDSASLGRGHAALGLLAGGLQPADVARAVRLSGARVVHAHNLHPTLGWRALAGAR